MVHLADPTSDTYRCPSLSLRVRVCHPTARTYVRLLGPCFKTGRLGPFRQHHDTRKLEALLRPLHDQGPQHAASPSEDVGYPTASPEGARHSSSRGLDPAGSRGDRDQPNVSTSLPPNHFCPPRRVDADLRAPPVQTERRRRPEPRPFWVPYDSGDAGRSPDENAHMADPNRFPFNNFKHFLTLFSKFFSSLPHGTCSLSVSRQYLALGEIYLPIRAAIPNNSTLCKFYTHG